LNIDLSQVLILFSILIVSLTFHEAAHAWSADRLGDSTARMLGRVSLNPAVHVDPIGTIAFPLIAMVTNLPLLGWAKPVPVNTLNLRRHWKQKFMLIAAAGPASNLILAGLAAIGVRIMGYETSPDGVAGTIFRLLDVTVTLNVLLAVFNMVPVPPLDGGNVLAGLLPGKAHAIFEQMRPYGFLIIYALLLSGILFAIVDPVQDAIRRLLVGQNLSL
jgi:Zn-dependent protease